MNRQTKSALWWALPVLVLVLYFLLFQPREADGPAPELEPEPAQQDNLTSPDAPPVQPPADADAPGSEDNAQLIRDREFIGTAFPLLSSWDLAAVKPLLSAATIEGISDEQLSEVIAVLGGRLGELQSYEVPEPTTAADGETPVDGTGMLQHYAFIAHYEAGDANVELVLHQLPETSSLYSFDISIPN